MYLHYFSIVYLVDSTKIFDVKPKPKQEAAEKEDLESVKKLTDEVLNEEPPKVEKPKSIADKVLKALHSQQHDQQRPLDLPDPLEETEIEQIPEPVVNAPVETKAEAKPKAEAKSKAEAKPKAPETDTDVSTTTTESPPTEPVASTSTRTPSVRGTVSPTTVTHTSTTATAIATTTATATGKKPVLGSTPEHKIDILESISPKNNDLSETIQKLETAISKSVDHGHELSDDSTDSTDSEQRLIIEDESQSSETPIADLILNKQDSDQSYSAKQAHKEAKAAAASAKVAAALAASAKEERATRKVSSPPEDIVEAAPVPDIPTAPEPVVSDVADDTTPDKSADEPITDDNASIASRSDECAGDGRKDDAMSVDNAQNESLSLLLCEETIPGSPAPACPKDTCDSLKKGYDIYSHSADIDAPKPMDHEPLAVETKSKSKNATPGSSPHDSVSQDDSSEEISKKQGMCIVYGYRSVKASQLLALYRIDSMKIVIPLISQQNDTDQDRNISPKKRRCTRKQSDLEQSSKRRKTMPRRNSRTAGSGKYRTHCSIYVAFYRFSCGD